MGQLKGTGLFDCSGVLDAVGCEDYAIAACLDILFRFLTKVDLSAVLARTLAT